MRVLHLSYADAGGGAARAAHRLHEGLRAIGVDSHMLVYRRASGDPHSRKVTFSNAWPARVGRAWRKRAVARDWAAVKPTLPAGFEWFSDDRTDVGGDLAADVVRSGPWSVLNLHWVGGLLDWGRFFPRLPATLPLVWRLADMGPLTGGCHYDGGCGKFHNTCGACPVLGSTGENDLSRQGWDRRHRALASIASDRLTLVGPSRWIAAESRNSSLLSRFPVRVIPNGLDTDRFAPRDRPDARRRLGVPADGKVVLFVAEATDVRRKGFDRLLAALGLLAGLPGLFLLSVGERRPAVPEGLGQLHLGRVGDDARLADAYSAADVFVIPSLQESFGQTVTEAMACGTPVVGFDVGGIPDMVRPGHTGELARPAGDPDALAAAIGRVLGDPARAAAMGTAARRSAVDEYDVSVQARQFRDLYQSVAVPA